MAEFKRSYQQDLRQMQAERDEYSKVGQLQECYFKSLMIRKETRDEEAYRIALHRSATCSFFRYIQLALIDETQTSRTNDVPWEILCNFFFVNRDDNKQDKLINSKQENNKFILYYNFPVSGAVES